MPLFWTKKEPFGWLKSGRKTVDVRKGSLRNGEIAVYLCGRNVLKMKITKNEVGSLEDLVRLDNYNLIIPSALSLGEALAYFHRLYTNCDSVFCAYYVEPFEN